LSEILYDDKAPLCAGGYATQIVNKWFIVFRMHTMLSV